MHDLVKIGRTRLLVFVLAFCSFGWSYAFFDPSTVEVLVPDFWPWAFLGLGVLLFLFGFILGNRILYFATGVYGPCLALFRIWGVLANNAEHIYPSPRRFVLGICVYTAVGVLWAACWNMAVGPAHAWASQHRGE